MEPYQILEREFAEWSGLDPAGMCVCSSGTAALHLALEAFQLPPSSEVIVPDYTMVACPRAVVLAGLKPVLVDCGDDLLIDADRIDAACSTKTTAILIVHVYGRAFSFDDGWDVPGMFQIEDLAEAHGVRPHPSTDAVCWSFFRNKIIAGEEGGAVYFRDPAHATLARSLRTLGFTPEHDYTHIPRGHNYRLANCLAEKIRASLKNADTNIRVRRVIEGWYDARCPATWRMPRRDAVWVYDLRIPGMTADVQTRLAKALRTAGIEARHGFKPMTTLDEYRGPVSPNAGRLASEIIYLPVVPFVTTEADVAGTFGIIESTLA